jgi:hypothetical protein
LFNFLEGGKFRITYQIAKEKERRSIGDRTFEKAGTIDQR